MSSRRPATTPSATSVAKQAKLAADAAAWGANVLSSVLIIFVNKALMGSAGYGFAFATTLSALHYATCSASTAAMNWWRNAKRASMPAKDLAIFTATANASIISLNLSLMMNAVGFYQVAKLLIIPFVCGVERLWLGRRFSRQVTAAVAVVVVGVAIVTVTDLTMDGGNPAGAVVAAISVVSSGMQQILCRTMQQKHGLSANELLSNTAPAQAASLLALGPWLDARLGGRGSVFDYAWTPGAARLLALSCAAAVAVNVSQFACLGRFSAVSFQVLGHAKTVSVLLGGWALFGDRISGRQAAGMAIAVAGMVAYGIATSPPPPPAAAPVAPSAVEASTAVTTSASPSAKNGVGLGAGGGDGSGVTARGRGAATTPPAAQPFLPVDLNKLRAAAAGSALFGPVLKAVGLSGADGKGDDDGGFKIRAHTPGGGRGLGVV